MTAANNSSSHNDTAPKSWLQKIMSFALPLVIILCAVAIAFWLTKSGPKAGKRAKPRNAILVETQPVTITAERIVLTANGTVKAAREIELKAQVGGEVIQLSPNLLPGGHVQQGELLLTVDPQDYQLALRQQENNVSRAAAELQLEQGNQLLAQKEYELLGATVSDDEKQLMLRQPQLQALQAALDSTKALRDLARLNLKRTRITAPFNGAVAAREVNVGSQITAATTLATLIDSDRYWVEVTLPVTQLRWIDIPRSDNETGSIVRITTSRLQKEVNARQGRVLRLLPGLEEQGRMARLLVEIDDPLSLKAENADIPPLLIGAWVEVQIECRKLPAVATIDRAWLREGDQVWLLDEAGTLEIRPVQVAFRDRERVLVGAGLTVGDNLIISSLSAPVAGMTLRIKDETKSDDETPEPKKQMQEPKQ